jgi:hypothetical protein
MRRSRRTRHCRFSFRARDLRPNDILMEVLYTGLCHTNLHQANHNLPGKDGRLEQAQQMGRPESPRTTKLYDRTKNEVTLREVERIRL